VTRVITGAKCRDGSKRVQSRHDYDVKDISVYVGGKYKEQVYGNCAKMKMQ
jgi:hypothetical protein